MRKIGILLSGCGRYDGSDATETILLVSALERAGHRIIFMAPDTDQSCVVDHATGTVDEEAQPRNVLCEAARLASGPVREVAGVHPSELDALVVPGGVGVVRSLCPGGAGRLGGGDPLPAIRCLLNSLKKRGVVIAGLGLARIILLRHRGISPADDRLMTPMEATAVEETDGLLYSPGRMGSDSTSEIAQGIERLVKRLDELLREQGGEQA